MLDTRQQTNAEILEDHVSTFERVASDALANTLSGVGLGLLSGVALWAVGASWATVGTWATASAVAWTGAINWLRFSQDEITNRLTFWQMARDIDELNAEVAALTTENTTLTDKIRWQEMRLKQPIRVNGRALEPEADPAQADAVALIDRRYGRGVAVTARMMMQAGWSQQRYAAALALLRDAGVVEVKGTQTQWREYHSPAEACSALSFATPVVMNSDTSIQAGEG